MNCVPYGPTALLFRFAEQVGDEAFAKGSAIALELERNPPAGMVEFVSGFTTVLVIFEDPERRARIADELLRRLQSCNSRATQPLPAKEIPVVYDGPDLARVAEAHHLTVAEVPELHAATTYKVYMLGFSPGFPYLGDLDPRLHTPRLASPRTRVPAGSIAIGGSHTGIYSVEGPGGWNIIGRTNVQLFDAKREGAEMFFLRQGDRVRFVPQRQ
jgi:KipI family sensor histidine kinase inhibitor